MLKKFFEKYFDNILYVQLSSGNLKVVDVRSGLEFSEPPFIAIEKGNPGKSVVKAIGFEAQALKGAVGLEVENPFLHPRQLIANFQKAEKILRHAVRVACGKKLFSPSPKVVLQPLEKLEGGLTEVEIRAFRELCLGAGAREVVLYIGSPLSTQSFNFEEVKRQGL
jgi:rod shape-determining protein MreB